MGTGRVGGGGGGGGGGGFLFPGPMHALAYSIAIRVHEGHQDKFNIP